LQRKTNTEGAIAEEQAKLMAMIAGNIGENRQLG
jgi:hypothetical protein